MSNRVTTWQTATSETLPKDRPIFVVGQVCWQLRDDAGHPICGGVNPFRGCVEWEENPEWNEKGFWAWADSGMSVARDPQSKVVIFDWIDLPGEAVSLCSLREEPVYEEAE